MTTSESKGRFFTKRIDSNRFAQQIESIRIANWNVLVIATLLTGWWSDNCVLAGISVHLRSEAAVSQIQHDKVRMRGDYWSFSTVDRRIRAPEWYYVLINFLDSFGFTGSAECSFGDNDGQMCGREKLSTVAVAAADNCFSTCSSQRGPRVHFGTRPDSASSW